MVEELKLQHASQLVWKQSWIIYIYIYYNMKVDIACILKINIYIPIKKFTQNKYSKKNVLL